jgi:hypothetical protein
MPLYGPSGQVLLATTGVAGYTMVNATGNIITWTPPSDGALHRFNLFLYMAVTSNTTGGAIGLTFTDPGSNPQSLTILSGTQGTGAHGTTLQGYEQIFAKAGTTVAVTQATAMTAGAAVVWAELWGS